MCAHGNSYRLLYPAHSCLGLLIRLLSDGARTHVFPECAAASFYDLPPLCCVPRAPSLRRETPYFLSFILWLSFCEEKCARFKNSQPLD
jgi:hypothetical protein